MNRPKVLVFIATTILGGPGKGVFQLLDRLKDKDVNIVLVAYKLKADKDTEFIKLAKQKAYKLEILEQHGILNISLFRSACKLVRKHNINIVQSHGYKSHLIALYLKIFERIKWVSFVHGWSKENIKMHIYSATELILVRFSDIVVAVSPSIQKVLKKWFVGNVLTILNAIDKNEIPGKIGGIEQRRRLGIDDSEFVIGTIGRLSPEKGHKYLIEAIGKINHEKMRLLIVGDGPLKNDLQKLCNDFQLNDVVVFCGYDKNIRDYYESLNILVLPSLQEGLPNVVLEAMVLNVPVISTDVGGVREIIIDGYNGWVIKSGNTLSIVAKLNELINNKKLIENVASRLHDSLFPKFCPEIRANKIVSIYEKLLT